ncbi:MAG: sigma-70 family RNA polymerase sigma factor [Gemmatimonadota bacterium]|nr:MAG: sigma-70 family RNA polymerase sigma factor [Gemmatimonadota bacterium]
MPEQPLSLDPGTLEHLRVGVRLLAARSLSDPEACEEVVQETLARALDGIRRGRLDDRTKLGAYVRSIARHVIADVHRARSRDPRSGIDTDALPSGEGGPLEALISAEERQRLRFALQGLSPRDRKILELSYHEGLTPGQIARRIDEPPARVRKRKSRALARLRRAFHRIGHD